MAYRPYSNVPEVNDLADVSRPVKTDLSAMIYHFVKLDTDGYLVANGDGEGALGILQNKVDGTLSEKMGVVRTFGLSKLKLGNTVAQGDFLKSASGAGTPVTADKDIYSAKAQSAGASGDEIAVLIQTGFTSATFGG